MNIPGIAYLLGTPGYSWTYLLVVVGHSRTYHGMWDKAGQDFLGIVGHSRTRALGSNWGSIGGFTQDCIIVVVVGHSRTYQGLWDKAGQDFLGIVGHSRT